MSVDKTEDDDEKKYDLLSVIIIRLLEEEGKQVGSDLIRMLNTLLSMKIDADKKKDILTKEFDMKMTREMGEKVNKESNLGEYLVEMKEKRVTEEVAYKKDTSC